MAPRRSTKKARDQSGESVSEPVTLAQLPPQDEHPPTLAILPKNLSAEAKFLSLKNPSNKKLSRYIYCPKSGFYELTIVSAGGNDHRSCLFVPQGPNEASSVSKEAQANGEVSDLGQGYVIDQAQMLVATPFDTRLLLMPLIQPGMLGGPRDRPHMARMADDLFNELGRTSKHMKYMLRFPSFRKLLLKGLNDLFEPVDAMGETMYRSDSFQMLDLLIEKAQKVVSNAWPSSLERHVQRKLEVPAAVAAMRASQTRQSTESSDSSELPKVEEGDALQSERPAEPANFTPLPSEELQPSQTVIDQMRLKIAISFIFQSYVPPKLKDYFEKVIASGTGVNFNEANEYLAKIESLKKEAHALSHVSGNVSRKRAAEEEADAAEEARTEKRRKKEEEDKKRKQESRASKDLKKVNTAGMQKLSSFFSKKPSASAA